MNIFENLNRVNICHQPTPIEVMPRLSEQLGVNLYIKRDDCTGLAGGGNKTRKLEYLIGEAIAQGSDTLITVGGIQSNHARQTAAAAAKFGLDCELILEDVPGTVKQDYYTNGNILLDKIFGANIHRPEEGIGCLEYAYELEKKLNDSGKSAFVIPLGGSNVAGSMGYVRCANEIVAQANDLSLEFDRIIVATGSAGTQAGLLAGLIMQSSNTPVLGICVSQDSDSKKALIESLLRESLDFLKLDPLLAEGRVLTDDAYVGEGYGIHTEQTIEAIHLCAQTEGLLLDPVYTGKGMAGLIDYCRTGKIRKDENILFIHTGGSQGLFAYSDIF